MARSTVEDVGFEIIGPERSAYRRKRFLLPFGISACIALAGVLALISSGTVGLPFRQVTVVRALMASKADFFNDGEVRRILMANGIQVHLTDSTGSLEIPKGEAAARSYDFVMPSGQITSKQVHERQGGTVFYPFTTPLVIGAFREYAEALRTKGIATPQGDTSLYYTLDIAGFVALTLGQQTWRDIDTRLSSANRITAQSPDPCLAYSGAAYLGMVAFAVNHRNAPTQENAERVAARVKPLFEVEGQFGASIGRNFFDPDGRTFAPVGVMYEHQYLAHQIRTKERTGAVDAERVLLYPDAHHHTEPWLIAFSEAGERVGRLLREDAGLKRRALELGFRGGGGDGGPTLADLLRERGIDVPAPGAGTETYLPNSADLETMVGVVGRCPGRVPL